MHDSHCWSKGVKVSGGSQCSSWMIIKLGHTDELYPRTTISELPDDVLLDIFGFYVDKGRPFASFGESWHVLVHVCQRWRCLVFASPRRLDLRLLWTNRRPVKKMLDIWPALPIFILTDFFPPQGKRDVSNVVLALKRHDRICKIMIWNTPKSLIEEFVAIKGPFPVLTHLTLWNEDDDLDVPILPDSFLGGSAPRLRSLLLERIPFPSLPKLLSSTTGLVILHLTSVPDSGFISPKVMVTALSELKSLKSLGLHFDASRISAHRENRHPPASAVTRTILPALTYFRLSSDGEYVEDFMSQIDTPVLDSAIITFCGQTESDTPQLRHFISRTEAFKAPHQAKVDIQKEEVSLTF